MRNQTQTSDPNLRVETKPPPTSDSKLSNPNEINLTRQQKHLISQPTLLSSCSCLPGMWVCMEVISWWRSWVLGFGSWVMEIVLQIGGFGFLAHSLYETHRRRRIVALLFFVFVFVKLSLALRSSPPLTPSPPTPPIPASRQTENWCCAIF